LKKSGPSETLVIVESAGFLTFCLITDRKNQQKNILTLRNYESTINHFVFGNIKHLHDFRLVWSSSFQGHEVVPEPRNRINCADQLGICPFRIYFSGAGQPIGFFRKMADRLIYFS
jgi:hypothetical protein